jgi:hypothetical protein
MGEHSMNIYVVRSSAVAARALDGEMVIMSTKDSTLFTLNEVATEIWQAADGRTSLADIVRNYVCAKFETNEDAAYSDAEAFCRELAAHGILTLSSDPIVQNA